MGGDRGAGDGREIVTAILVVLVTCGVGGIVGDLPPDDASIWLAGLERMGSVAWAPYWGAAGADLLSTEMTLRACAHCSEANPLPWQQSGPGRVIATIAVSYGLALLLEALVRKSGEELPWWAEMLALSPPTVVRSWAAIHNWRIYRRVR